MAVEPVDFRGNLGSANTARRWSPNVWTDCPWTSIKEGSTPGISGLAFFDDFDSMPLIGTQTTQIGYDKYKVFATSGDTVTPVMAVNSVTVPFGIMRFLHNTDNNSCSLAQAYQSYRMSGLQATSGKLWFECRMAVNSLATNMQGIMVGLAETSLWTLATGVPFNGGDPITNGAAMIGFRLTEDGLGAVDTVVSDRATSFTNIHAAATTISAAYTFIKLGMVYDPSLTSKQTKFFINGIEDTTYYTSTSMVATTNLKAGDLGLIYASVSDSAATGESYLDWWRVAQLDVPPT